MGMRRFRHGGFASSFCNLACSRPSDSEEDAKVKGTRNVGRAKKRKRKAEGKSPSGLFSSSRFLNFSGPVYLGAWLFAVRLKESLHIDQRYWFSTLRMRFITWFVVTVQLQINKFHARTFQGFFKEKLHFSRTKIYLINQHSLTPFDHPIG